MVAKPWPCKITILSPSEPSSNGIWDLFLTSDGITSSLLLDLVNTTDIEITRIRNRLRWSCHVARMPDERPVKALSYGELTEGSRRVGHPFLRRKDTLQDILKRRALLRLCHGDCEKHCRRPCGCRRLITEVYNTIDDDRRKANREKRAKRHERRSVGKWAALDEQLVLLLIL